VGVGVADDGVEQVGGVVRRGRLEAVDLGDAAVGLLLLDRGGVQAHDQVEVHEPAALELGDLDVLRTPPA